MLLSRAIGTLDTAKAHLFAWSPKLRNVRKSSSIGLEENQTLNLACN